MKICTKCNVLQSVDAFHKRKKSKDGLRSSCKSCDRRTSIAYYATHKSECAIRSAEWYSKNSETAKKAARDWQKANPERYQENKKAWDIANADAIKVKQARWRANNPEYAAAYRAAKLNATPKWLVREQLLEIQWYYDTAKELQWLSEEPLEVDHIVPLQGDNVSGLHVPWNLQILPKSLNCSKGNRHGS